MSRYRRILTVWLALLVLATGLNSRVLATAYCEIGAPEEGFAGLRETPSDAAAILERMAPGEEVRLAQGETGAWIEVYYWPGGRFPSGEVAGDEAAVLGWMRSRDIVPDSCG